MNAPASVEVPVRFRRLFRAHISAPDSSRPELTAFVEAGTRDAAVRKIAGAIAVLEYRNFEDVAERLYNCSSAAELIDEGLSDDLEARLLETGWSGGKPTHFVEHPLVLLADPTPLLKVWARVGLKVTP
jgi:hypothetical protein